jgi:polysaccharide export outer membrane protein
MMRRALTSAAALTIAGTIAGCHPGAPATLAPPPDCRINLNDTSLGPGDVFDVRVYDEAQLSGTYQVSADGSINFPLIGSVQVAGLTPIATGKLLESKLSQGYLRNPQVSILVKEYNSKKVSVLGQVTKPGTFTYTDSMTVIEAVVLAGGFTPIAAKNDTVVTRIEKGNKVRLNVPVEAISEGRERNLCLRPGDIVFVPERIF